MERISEIDQKCLKLWRKYRRIVVLFLLHPVLYALLQDIVVGLILQNPDLALLNILLLASIQLLVSGLTGSVLAGSTAECVFAMLFILTEQYLIRLRGTPLSVSDFSFLGTALQVKGGYDLMPEKENLGTAIIFALLFWYLFRVLRGGRKPSVKRRAVFVLSGILLPAGILWHALDPDTVVYVAHFDKVFSYAYNGGLMDLIYSARGESEPEGYREGEAKRILEGYGSEEEGQRPDIIVVMCESFSDPGALWDLKASEDPLPFYHSLLQSENTQSGLINVSVIGGGTVNTEYEFLSGNSMRFHPEGYPYDLFFHGDTDVSYMMPEWLKSIGYAAVSVHPSEAKGYRRDEVYVEMGFEDSVFLDGFEDPAYIRDFVSDGCCFEKILELYQARDQEKPWFCFAVTIQDHGYYDDHDPSVEAMGERGVGYSVSFSYDGDIKTEGGDRSLETYLSLLKLTDAALQGLVGFVDSLDKDTVLVFFGDHQPAPSVTASVSGMADSAALSDQAHYRVPFFIHANFDIGRKEGIETSANYLQSLLYDACGMGRNGYQAYLKEKQQDAPVLSRFVKVKDADTEKEMQDVQWYVEHRDCVLN